MKGQFPDGRVVGRGRERDGGWVMNGRVSVQDNAWIGGAGEEVMIDRWLSFLFPTSSVSGEGGRDGNCHVVMCVCV
jgi:hypothetical protein